VKVLRGAMNPCLVRAWAQNWANTHAGAGSPELFGTDDQDDEDAFDRHRAYFIFLNFSADFWSVYISRQPVDMNTAAARLVGLVVRITGHL
jgi:hypothetical protein